MNCATRTIAINKNTPAYWGAMRTLILDKSEGTKAKFFVVTKANLHAWKSETRKIMSDKF